MYKLVAYEDQILEAVNGFYWFMSFIITRVQAMTRC